MQPKIPFGLSARTKKFAFYSSVFHFFIGSGKESLARFKIRILKNRNLTNSFSAFFSLSEIFSEVATSRFQDSIFEFLQKYVSVKVEESTSPCICAFDKH